MMPVSATMLLALTPKLLTCQDSRLLIRKHSTPGPTYSSSNLFYLLAENKNGDFHIEGILHFSLLPTSILVMGAGRGGY